MDWLQILYMVASAFCGWFASQKGLLGKKPLGADATTSPPDRVNGLVEELMREIDSRQKKEQADNVAAEVAAVLARRSPTDRQASS